MMRADVEYSANIRTEQSAGIECERFGSRIYMESRSRLRKLASLFRLPSIAHINAHTYTAEGARSVERDIFLAPYANLPSARACTCRTDSGNRAALRRDGGGKCF